jgi:ribonucleotide reductase alpha subunit
MAICNLASINLAKAKNENKEDVVNVICRLLDN